LDVTLIRFKSLPARYSIMLDIVAERTISQILGPLICKVVVCISYDLKAILRCWKCALTKVLRVGTRYLSSIPRVRALRFPFSSRNIKREALTIKPGPTESGEVATTSRPPPTPVGGEMLPVDKLGVFLSQYWLLIIILMVPLMLLLYVKRNAALKLLSPILPKLLRLR